RPIVGETMVLPEALETTQERLHRRFASRLSKEKPA
ncbi:MAG: hypothetical protein QOD49_712, partial [Actinomycetota bacterium]|nr:hypothetical protein [Actinomycetota bacterium]